MKRINGIILTLALLMVGTLGAWAQYSDKISDGYREMFYAFGGGERTTDVLKNSNQYEVSHSYTCRIGPGGTIALSGKKLKGPDSHNVIVIQVRFTKKDGSLAAPEKKEIFKDGSGSLKIQVPEGTEEVSASIRYLSSKRLTCYVTWYVRAGATTTPAPTQPTEVKPENYKGTYERHGGKMEYSFTNCKVTDKDDNWSLGPGGLHPYLTTTTGGQSLGSYITGKVKPGATMALACKKVKGNTTLDSVLISVQAWNNNSTLINKKFRGKGSIQKSFQVPTNATVVSIDLVYAYMDATFKTTVRLDVTKDLPNVPGSKFKWNTVANDDRCIHCKGQWSEYTIDNYPMAEYGTMCNSEKEWHKHKNEHWEYTNIFYNDHIYTNGERFTLAKGEVIHNTYRDEELIFRGQTHAWLRKRLDDGTDRWSFYKGFIIGKHLKRSGKPSSSFETDELIVVPKGTIYILQKDDNSTQAYLLQGSMEVTNKKDNKKVTLKPGQVATGTKNGQMKVQTFDAQAMARKYDIDTSEIPATTTTTPTAPATTTTPTRPNNHSTTATEVTVKRYEVERAIVKYKVTQGSQEGTMAKAFDNYGTLERRELKMGNQTTLQLTQGNTSYNLDRNAKTYKAVTGAELNFLNMNDPVMKKLNLQKKGTATILGKPCTVYTGQNVEYSVWKGIVLKKVQRSGNTTTTTEATSVELPTSVDSKYFNMPTGYRKK